MFKKILIANRGEIAVRVIHACQELGIPTVAVYSEADRNALHTHLADEAYYIGPAPSAESYLSIPAIITAACATGCDAIHPGYGFLAENPVLAETTEKFELTFIGPAADAIKRLGMKSSARSLARTLGIPLVPGSEGIIRNFQEAAAVASSIGYPVLLKAANGGGGRGIRIANSETELRQLVDHLAGQSGLPQAGVYIEKYLEQARHIEIQILGDRYGSYIHLGERESSIQRRRQKLLEESPSPALSEGLRRQICDAALRLASAAGYTNAGTAEFLLDQQDRFYFMEVNARIQVEHPVTEMVTGVDLVKEQIHIAAGRPLPFHQDEIVPRGWAIECRITAEDPANGLLPSAGTITAFMPPSGPGIRLDTGVQKGSVVDFHYDSLIAKLIAWGQTRHEATARMLRALAHFRIEGIKTSIPLHRYILSTEAFQRGEVNTEYLERLLGNRSALSLPRAI